MFLFMPDYERELRIEIDIRRKGKMENIMKFKERMKMVQKEVEAALKRI